MAEYLEMFMNIASDIKSNLPGYNGSTLDLMNLVLSDNTLLEAVANQTSLSTKLINLTITSVLKSTGCIEEVYQHLNSSQERESSNTT